MLLVAVDGETKIYRRVNDKKGPELVCLREPLDIEGDHKIADLIARYKQAESDDTRAVMKGCKRELALYAKYLAKSSGTDEDDITRSCHFGPKNLFFCHFGPHCHFGPFKNLQLTLKK